MRERLKTEDGIAAYRQRGHIAETPHGHIKHNMGIRQLSVRGKPKAGAEWTFICAVHNLRVWGLGRGRAGDGAGWRGRR